VTEHISLRLLLLHLDGELSLSEMREADEHLSVCEACRGAMERFREDLDLIAEARARVSFQSSSPEWPPMANLLASAERPASAFMLRLRFGGALSAAAGILIAIVLFWTQPATVSAKEILSRIERADDVRVTLGTDSIIRQTVRVVRRERKTSQVVTGEIESWKSPKSALSIPKGEESTLEDLAGRYRSNGLDMKRPLSQRSYAGWAQLAGSPPTVSTQQNEIRLAVSARPEARFTGFETAELRVDPATWLVKSMKIEFQDCSLELSELNFAVLKRTQVPLDILARLEPPSDPRPPEKTFVSAKAAKAVPPPEPMFSDRSSVLASRISVAEVELGVTVVLHRLGADLGEPIEVVRTDATLTVDVSQVSPERKERLTDALHGLSSVEVQSESKPMTEGATQRILPPARASSPPDDRLTKWFGGGDMQERFARTAIESSTALLSRWFAVAALAHQWPTDREAQLSETSKRDLTTILGDHATAMRELVFNLDVQFKVLARAFSVAPTPPTAFHGGDWRSASTRGLPKAKELDRLIRSLLTSTSAPSSVDQALPAIMQHLADLEPIQPAETAK
jgi:anti-sigma factor RsiW